MSQDKVKGSPGIPTTARMNYNYDDRHVINDTINRKIYIPVMHGYDGGLKQEEFQQIKAGMYMQYLPDHIRQSTRQLIEHAGYKVVPVFINGYNTGTGNILYQIAEIGERNGLPFLMDGKNYKAEA